MWYEITQKPSPFFIFAAFICIILSGTVQARPVSYPGGWTLITENDKDRHFALFHFSPTPTYSIGFRHEYRRDTSVNLDLVQVNYLAKRWNFPKAQANFYIHGGAGIAYDDGETAPAAMGGISADWENRRFFTSYSNHFFTSAELDSTVRHNACVGVAPYVADTGALHTWLMLEAEYTPASEDTFSLTPLVRFFKGVNLLEAGYNVENETLLFNFTKRF